MRRKNLMLDIVGMRVSRWFVSSTNKLPTIIG
jgi:hypothetical protein